MSVKKQMIIGTLQSMTTAEKAEIWAQEGVAPLEVLQSITDKELLDALVERDLEDRKIIDALSLEVNSFTQFEIMSQVERSGYLEDVPDEDLIDYIDDDWLADYVAETGLFGAKIDLDSFVRRSGFTIDPVLRRKTFMDLGIHETLGRVLELIEQGRPEKAHATLDQLINPRWESRADKLRPSLEVSDA